MVPAVGSVLVLVSSLGRVVREGDRFPGYQTCVRVVKNKLIIPLAIVNSAITQINYH